MIIYPKKAAMTAKRQLSTFGIKLLASPTNPNPPTEAHDYSSTGLGFILGAASASATYVPASSKTKQEDGLVKGSLVRVYAALGISMEDLSINAKDRVSIVVEKFPIGLELMGTSNTITPGDFSVPYALFIITESGWTEESLIEATKDYLLTLVLERG